MKKLAILLIALLLIGTLAACQTQPAPPEEEDEEVLRGVVEGADEEPDDIQEESPEEPDEEPDTGPVENSDDDIVYDLPDLTLIGHDLADSQLFESATLSLDLVGEETVQVIVFREGDTWEGMGFLDSFLGGVELFYAVFPEELATIGLTAVDMLSGMIAGGLAYEDELAPSDISAIHATADGKTALFAAASPEQYDEVGILLVQQIPGTDTILMMSILLDLMFWEESDELVLAGLSEYIGFDLRAFVAHWL